MVLVDFLKPGKIPKIRSFVLRREQVQPALMNLETPSIRTGGP